MKKSTAVLETVFLVTLCTLIAAFGAAIFILPQKSFSQKENRPLETLPALRASSVLNGSYFEKLGEFYKDQFPLRDSFTAIYSLSEKRLGKIETNGVISTKNGICVALPKQMETSKAQKNFDAIYSLAEQRKLYLYVPPSSFEVFEDELPRIYPQDITPSAADFLEDEALDDFLELKGKANEEYYYKTDHHWTTKGAYFAYTQICKRMGIQAYSEEYFTKEEVSDNFLGTPASRSGLPDWLISEDRITLYRYKGDTDFTVQSEEIGQTQKGFYNFEALEGRDKYTVFLGGNYAHLSISDGQKKPKLLLIKDSFANCIIPFLALHFELEVIDPRYCTKAFLNEQLSRRDFDRTLILMSFDTLTTNIFD